MTIKGFFYKIRRFAVLPVMALFTFVSLSSCLDEQAPGSYYTFTGQTVASYLDNRPDEFSDFIVILKRASLWSELSTYGNYTCFAPTNSAIAAYLEDKNVLSVDSLTDADCDTLSWTHLVNMALFMTDLSEGILPSVNLNDRFLTLSFDSLDSDDESYKLRYCINKSSHIISMDDTVQNGVVQVVDSVIYVAGDFIFDVIKADHRSTIFFQALNLIGLEDSLKEWHDESYFIHNDSVEKGVKVQGGGSDYQVYYWGEKKTNFTFFIETDEVFRANGINNLDDLIAYAKQVYDQSFPVDRGKYDNDFTHRKNPLNRFISYHILPFGCASSAAFNCRQDIISSRCILTMIDPEDYFESYLPHSIMRISTVTSGSEAGVYINRRGIGSTEPELGRSKVKGIRIFSTSQMTGVDSEGSNGFFHYIDNILVYDKKTREDVLNRRMRIDCCTLSPDFMTSGARQRKSGGGNEGIGFKQPKNFHSYTDDYVMWVRSATPANWSYEGDGVDLQGNYDLYFKLPPVPYDGTWELRLSYRGYKDCGVVQNYIGESPYEFMPCGIPTDLRLDANSNPNIGWVDDQDLETDEAINSHDKSMRNRGYMKGPDSHTNGDLPFRSLSTMARRIVTTQYFYAEKDYYLRMKLVLDNPKAEMNFDYMEFCPKSIYDSGEDKH